MALFSPIVHFEAIFGSKQESSSYKNWCQSLHSRNLGPRACAEDMVRQAYTYVPVHNKLPKVQIKKAH